MVHNRPIPSIEDRCAWILDYLDEYRKANHLNPKSIMSVQDALARFGQGENIIMHTDAAFDVINRKSGIGCVIRDKDGTLIAGLASSSNVCFNPICAEAAAILEGLCFARRLNIDRMTVMSDSLVLVKAIRGEGNLDSSIDAILWDIRDLLSSFHMISFMHVN